jgi:hypothetical protein
MSTINTGDCLTRRARSKMQMKSRGVTRTDESGPSHQHDVVRKERLDEWLDEALADTFPASDPVASPPSDPPPVQDGRSGANRSPAGAPTPQRSRH